VVLVDGVGVVDGVVDGAVVAVVGDGAVLVVAEPVLLPPDVDGDLVR
jgi:hypothetical protein